jgi:hypothetical protein
MTPEKRKVEVGLAITAIFHEAGRLADRVWMIQLAPPPDHEYHRPEHLSECVESLHKLNTAMKSLQRNLSKLAVNGQQYERESQ